MGWETRRRGSSYYTRSKWKGGRVVREYVGTGLLAELVALDDELKRLRKQEAAAYWKEERERLERSAGFLRALEEACEVLTRAHLLAGSYQDTIVDLSGANLRDANLREARLVNTSLGVQGFLTPHVERTDLSGADLSGAIMLGANLQAANLKGAELSEALVGTTDPNLPWHPNNADLEGVDLSDAPRL